MTLRQDLEQNLAEVRSRIAEAASRAVRDPDAVRLVGVTKTFPIYTCVAAFEAGIADLGENYVTELRQKAAAVPGATWHYLGPLQSHTARHVADHAGWVHGLRPGGAAKRLADRAIANGRPVQVLIQIDFTGTRSGVGPEALEGFADEVAALDGLVLSGLMTLPPAGRSREDARPHFVRLREMREDLRKSHPGAVELSMGMSLDYEVAVEEGATMVRVGTTLFGERAKR